MGLNDGNSERVHRRNEPCFLMAKWYMSYRQKGSEKAFQARSSMNRTLKKESYRVVSKCLRIVSSTSL